MMLKHEDHVEPNSYATFRPFFLSYNRHTWFSHAFDATPIQAQTSRSDNPGPRVVLPICAAGDRRGCAGPLGVIQRWSGTQDGESFGNPVGSYFSGLGQTYRYLQLDDGYLGVLGNRTLSWEWDRSCWDGSARVGGGGGVDIWFWYYPPRLLGVLVRGIYLR